MKHILHKERYDYKEIQDLGLALAFTNSELMSFTCKRKYAYNYVECLDINHFSQSLFYGTVWHYFCELCLLKIKESDTMISEDDSISIIENELSDFIRSELDKFSNLSDKEEILEDTIKNVSLGSIGWLKKWEEEIHPKYKVLDVEKVLIKPIIDKHGKELKCEMPIIYEKSKEKLLARLPGIGECFEDLERFRFNVSLSDYCTSESIEREIQQKEVPIYKVGKIDCILLDRDTNGLYILDHKTSKSPMAYAKKMHFDLQLQSYCALLDYNIKNGLYSEYENAFVSGVIWDIVSSKFNKPTYNNDGSLKKVKRGYITHALACKILSNPLYENFKDEYADYLDILKDRDSSNYVLLEEFISPKDIARSNAEDLVRTVQAIEFKKNCYYLDNLDDVETDLLLVRQPICQLYNFCEYANLCMQNCLVLDPNMIDFDRKHKTYWTVEN